MRVVIVGGHGQIARRTARLLVARGDEAVAVVRNPDHVADLAADGSVPVVLDLESTEVSTLADAVRGADAVIFAAGAGSGSGAARKDMVDRGAAVLLADAAEDAHVSRYLLVSSIGAGQAPPPGTDEVFAAYLVAKAAAERDVRARALDWTILRPGGLTDDTGTGLVRLALAGSDGNDGELPAPRTVPRDDVAAVLVALLDEPATSGLTLTLVSGRTAVAEAVATLTR